MKATAEIIALAAAISGSYAPDRRVASLNGKALLKNNRTPAQRKARHKQKIANASRRRNRR